MVQKDNQSWLQVDDDTFKPRSTGITLNTIPSGHYGMYYEPRSGDWCLRKMSIDTDKLIDIASDVTIKINTIINKFLDSKSEYLKYGFLYKRGLILHGEPGSGKTCIVHSICDRVIRQYDATVIHLSSEGTVEGFLEIVEIFKNLQKDKLTVLIIEDLEFIANSNIESKFLNLIDGDLTLPDCIVIGTTNYIEKIKERITNRPSRFDDRIHVPMLSLQDRKKIILNKIPTILEDDLEKWIKSTDGYSFSHIIELIKKVMILDISFEDGIKDLNDLINVKKDSSTKYKSKPLGFNTNNTDR